MTIANRHRCIDTNVSSKVYRRALICGWLALLVAALPGAAFADPPVRLEFVLPTSPPRALSTQYTMNYPVELRARWAEDAGIYNLNLEPEYDGSVGYPVQTFVVFSDPGGCIERLTNEIFGIDRGISCLAEPPDEVYMEFSSDHPFVSDHYSGNGLMLCCGWRGPFQANDDWPGLVLLSNRGQGLVLDDDFNRTEPYAQKNLAGHLGAVGFELVDSQGYSAVSARAVMPISSTGPLIMGDGAVGRKKDGRYTKPVIYRVDGGPVQSGNRGETTLTGVYGRLLGTIEFELVAFLVSDTAPDTLSDLDGDRDVDGTDASLAGYTLISNEQRVRYRISSQLAVAALCDNWTQYDFDGNGITQWDDCGNTIGPGRINKR